MYCKFCGKQIADESRFCPYCGKPLEANGSADNANGSYTGNPYSGNTYQNRYQAPPPYCGPAVEPPPSAGWGVLCFFFPIVGLILYLGWHDTYPLRAKMCGKGALISVIVYVAVIVFWLIIAIIMIAVGTTAALSYSAMLSFL